MSVQINSEDYWDTRFETDWESNAGPEQSRFFSRLTLDLLPAWLLEQVADAGLTLADWGCAQGDGTAELAAHLPTGSVTGIDISPVAIGQAAARYPGIAFRAEDWLQGGGDPIRYDIVFSSNTLEHFQDPAAVLAQLARRARKAVVLTLPYREADRIAEHFASFDPGNLPAQLANGFQLAWARVRDCRGEPGGYWSGEQVVLVYGEPGWLRGLGLPLAGVRVEHDDPRTALLAERQAAGSQIESLQAQLQKARDDEARLKSHIADLDAQLASEQDTSRDLEQQLAAAQDQARRLAEWASRMDGAPLTYAVKRHGYRAVRAAYRALPVSPALRQRLRGFVSRVMARQSSALAFEDDDGAAQALLDLGTFAQPGPGGANRDVLVFSVIDWHFRIQRPQHLARGLARMGRRVFYISSTFVDAAEPGFQVERLHPGLELYSVRLQVPGAPAIYFAQPAPDVQRMIELGLAKLIAAYGATSTVSLLQHAFWYPIAFALPNSIRVYDCMDHHEGFGSVPAELIAAEKQMLQRSDLVIVTSDWLETFARAENRSVAMVRNAGEYTHFADQPAEVFRDAQGRRVIGYYGAIAEWFDIELVRTVARAHPDCLVLLVGNDTVQAARALKDVPNVQFTGEVPYARLPFYLWGFDVCLLPFQVIPLTLATNPVKVYEYLAAGKPVVAVDLPEIAQFGALVRKGTGHEAFVAQVGEALAQPGDAALVEARRAFARDQTWDHRVADLAAAVDQLRWPKVSVVVLTFNNLQLTQDCLASLVRESDYPELEIIVVDNASTDGSPEWLREWHQQNPAAKLVLNEKNLGFAAGNNVGLAAATGDYLVILNNDTVVTRGWVLTLLRHFERDAKAGLVGPVTNNIGNEAKVEMSYGNDLAAMRPQAMRHTLTHMGRHFQIRTAAFFCAMLSRATYERCGPLCEDYGLGFFEDDDYCRRVEAQGAHSLCAEDVFVHHHLSASFNKLPSREREELFARNKAIYEGKWGPWEPHTYRGASPLVERKLRGGQKAVAGTCCVCGQRTQFTYSDRALWREQLTCSHCKSTSRYRALARGLLQAVKELAGVDVGSLAELPRDGAGKRLKVYDTQPAFYHLHCCYPLPDLLKKTRWIHVDLSQYKPGKPLGQRICRGVTNQNLEALTFPDASIDVLVTSDVMEHVRLDVDAHREIHRVLKPGGIYLFTVPHDFAAEDTVVRVQVHDRADPSKDENILEPEYHGDTNGDGSGVLTYRLYGRDLVHQLEQLGFQVEYRRNDLPEFGILNTELFYCRKVRP